MRGAQEAPPSPRRSFRPPPTPIGCCRTGAETLAYGSTSGKTYSLSDGRRVPLRTPPTTETPETPGSALAPSGPVIPTASAIAAQHPLPASGVRLTGGLLHDWEGRNVTA